MKIAIEIARGLAWLHNKGIWHRDLKCENILVRIAGLPHPSD